MDRDTRILMHKNYKYHRDCTDRWKKFQHAVPDHSPSKLSFLLSMHKDSIISVCLSCQGKTSGIRQKVCLPQLLQSVSKTALTTL